MRYSTQVKPISYLKSHAAEIVKDLTERREPLLITQNGEARHFLEIIAAKNRVIYEVVGQIVDIHIICDTRQDFRTKLARRPLQRLRA